MWEITEARRAKLLGHFGEREMRIRRRYAVSKALPRTKVYKKLKIGPKLTQEEKEGADLLTRVWVRMQEQGRERDKAKARSQKKYFPGEIIWESMFLVSKVRGRLRRGYYR